MKASRLRANMWVEILRPGGSKVFQKGDFGRVVPGSIDRIIGNCLVEIEDGHQMDLMWADQLKKADV